MDLYARFSVAQLSVTDLVDVLSFSCGGDVWCTPLDEFFHERAYEQQLTGVNTTYVVRRREARAIVAMGTFADSTVGHPNPNSKKRPTVLCAFFGLARELHGQEIDGVKYSVAAGDLAFVSAFQERPEPNVALLYVDAANTKAVAMWRSYGFTEWGPPREEDGRTYLRMAAKKSDVLEVINSRARAA